MQAVFGLQIFKQLYSSVYNLVFGRYTAQGFATELVGELLVVYAYCFKRMAITSSVQFLLGYFALAIYAPQFKIVWLDQMVNTKVRLIIFFAAKEGEALYNQQKQDWELTVAQIMDSLSPN